MSKKSVNTCKSGKDFLDFASKKGATIEYCGKHPKVHTELGNVPIPTHANRDLGYGLRHKIIKQLAAIGIACFVIGCILTIII